MTTHTDEKQYRSTGDSRWTTKYTVEVDGGDVEISYKLRNGLSRILKDGSQVTKRTSRGPTLVNCWYSDYSDGAEYEIQIASPDDKRCRISNIEVEVEEQEDE